MADAPKQLFTIPDELWAHIQPLLPEEPPKPKGGRPRMDDGQAMTAIFYVFRRASNGRRCLAIWGLPAPCTIAFRNGSEKACSNGCGKRGYKRTTKPNESNGPGRR